jgi:hypothetical protein
MFNALIAADVSIIVHSCFGRLSSQCES